VLYGIAILVLFGCGTLQNLAGGANADVSMETQIAAQVAALAATSAQAVQPAPSQPEQPPQPTYTPLPTYTPFPTFTPYPTYTPVPSFTPPGGNIPPFEPLQTLAPTQTALALPGGFRPYTLRVRNMFRSTYWIGTYLPYGGNFIKPGWYVEFYPPQPMEMRIFFCRYTSYFLNHWQDFGQWDYEYDDVDLSNNWEGCRRWNWDYFDFWWDQGHLYNCAYHDYYVDEAFIEVGVP
jgi:hypothetical protein